MIVQAVYYDTTPYYYYRATTASPTLSLLSGPLPTEPIEATAAQRYPQAPEYQTVGLDIPGVSLSLPLLFL